MINFLSDMFTAPGVLICCIIVGLLLMKLFKVGKSFVKILLFIFIAWLIIFGLRGV